MTENWHDKHKSNSSFGGRLADSVAAYMGSWRFIILQTVAVVFWILFNLVEVFWAPFDPYPFILLNLVFSVQAAYAAPIIMQAQNRQSERDRHQADADYATNVQAKQEIEALQNHLARIEIDKLDRIISYLQDRRA